MSTSGRMILPALGASLLCSLVALAAWAPGAQATPAAVDFPWQHEEAYYKVQINGSEAIHAVMRVGALSHLKDQPYVAVAATAQTVGLFQSILEVDDRANTFIDPRTMRPLRAEKRFKERLFGGQLKERTYKVDYQPQEHAARVHKKSNQHADSDYTRHIPDVTHDGLSWFFDLRSRDAFSAGQELSYYVYDGWKLSRLGLKVLGEEDVYTPMGWHKAWKMSVSREVLDSRGARKDGKAMTPTLTTLEPARELGTLWLSRDERRLPVKIALTWKLTQSGTFTSQVEVVLVKHKPAQQPRQSLRPVKQPDAP